MIGQGPSTAAKNAVAWFNTNYNWAENTVGRGTDAYYYAIFAMAKGLTGSVGAGNLLPNGKDWSSDLVNQMRSYANFVKPNVYWERSGWLDGGKNMATAWVLEALVFSSNSQPAPQKIVVAGNVVSPIMGDIIIKTDTGLIDAVKDGAGNPLLYKYPTDNNPIDQTVQLPIAGVQFNIVNVPVGGTANFTVQLPAAACDPLVIASFVKNGGQKGNINWYKIKNGAWKGDPNIPIRFDPIQCAIVVTLTDGGIGDEDTKANGIIQDPGAPGQDLGTVANALRALRISVGVGAPATAAETSDLDVALDANGNKNGIGIADALLLLRRAVGAI
jgi:hypothetical protein